LPTSKAGSVVLSQLLLEFTYDTILTGLVSSEGAAGELPFESMGVVAVPLSYQDLTVFFQYASGYVDHTEASGMMAYMVTYLPVSEAGLLAYDTL